MVSYRCLQNTYPSQLPSLNVTLISMNEVLSSVQWAIASVISWTPSGLLKIILMDDFSSNGEQLDQGIVVKMTIY